jgi:hypothetical protein
MEQQRPAIKGHLLHVKKGEAPQSDASEEEQNAAGPCKLSIPEVSVEHDNPLPTAKLSLSTSKLLRRSVAKSVEKRKSMLKADEGNSFILGGARSPQRTTATQQWKDRGAKVAKSVANTKSLLTPLNKCNLDDASINEWRSRGNTVHNMSQGMPTGIGKPRVRTETMADFFEAGGEGKLASTFDMFVNTPWFKQKVCLAIFNEIDVDGDGTLDFAEVYLGVVLLYMNLKGLGK